MTDELVGGGGGEGQPVAAPAPASPGGGGAGSPAPAGPGASGGDGAGGVSGAEGGARKVAPIPEGRLYKHKPSKVPGLVEAEDDEGIPPAAAAPEKPAEKPAPKAPEAPKPGAAEDKGLQPGDDEHKKLLEADDATLDTPEKVIHAVKTLKGMHRSMLAKVEEAKRNQEAGFTRANEWYQEAQKKDAEIAELRQQLAGKGPAAPAPAGPGAPANMPSTGDEAADEAFAKSFDWNSYWALANSQNPQDRLAATMYHSTALVKFLNERQAQALESRFKPLDQGMRLSQAQRTMAGMFESMAEMTHADGGYAYPELRDDDTATKVGALWASLGFPKEWLQNPAGLHLAVLEYRHRTGTLANLGTSPQGGAAPSSAGNGQGVVDPSAAAAAAAAAALSGGGLPASRPGGPLSPGQAAAASISNAMKFAAPGVLP